jgi:fido (protein-threonine AMPylation protein)
LAHKIQETPNTVPTQLPATLLEQVQKALRDAPKGLALHELETRFGGVVSRRSLQRKLIDWESQGALRAVGIRRGRRYFSSPPLATQLDTLTQTAQPADETEIRLSAAGKKLRESARRPLADRTPIGYERKFLDGYTPDVTRYLSESLTRHLHELGRTPDDQRPAGTYARDILNRLLIDLSWSSSRLEGNTYSLLDTKELIEHGTAAPGKDAKETQMILNHKAAIELLVDSAEEIGVNRFTITNLHALLADNLIDQPAYAGRLRETPIGISESTYIPTAIPQLIKEMFDVLLTKAAAIQDPFEQSLFLMVQIPYLQPFVDVNKRTSRLAANISLIKTNLVPLSFIDVPQSVYIDGLIAIYEHTRIELMRDVFVWAYERSCRRYKTVRDSIPEPDHFRLRYRDALITTIGEVIRRKLKPTPVEVTSIAAALVPPEDLEHFRNLVVDEISQLHEGNIARFRLRPSEYRGWQSR